MQHSTDLLSDVSNNSTKTSTWRKRIHVVLGIIENQAVPLPSNWPNDIFLGEKKEHPSEFVLGISYHVLLEIQ